MDLNTFKYLSSSHLDRMRNLIMSMPHQGDKAEDSQKIQLLHDLATLHRSVNGVEDEDFEDDED